MDSSSSAMPGMDMPGMDMSGSPDNTTTAAAGMTMVFFEDFTTPLFSLGFRPSTQGQYAGMCIFLIVLATAHRLVIAVRSALAATVWAAPAAAARQQQQRAAAHNKLDAAGDAGYLLHQEKAVADGAGRRFRAFFADQPFRVANETARAVFDVVIGGIGYLLCVAISAPGPVPPGLLGLIARGIC